MAINWKNTKSNWGVISQWMHWLTALLLLSTFLMGWVAVRLPISPQKIDVFVWHKSLGLLTLLLVIFRLLWLMISHPPKALPGFSARHWQGAKVAHGLLYAGLILIPLTGWMLNSAAQIPLIFFSWWPSIPDWPIPSGWQDAFEFLHVYGFYSFLVLVVIHIVFAIWHHFHRTELLIRILPSSLYVRSVLAVFPLLILVAATGIFYQSKPPITKNNLEFSSENQSSLIPALHTPTENLLLPVWKTVASDSKLTFEGRYEGSPFSGAFTSFSARITLDLQKLDLSHLKADIHTPSITTFNDDWDSSLPEDDWFATDLFPTAHFIAKGFLQKENKLLTKGELTLKGIRKPVDFLFEWRSENEHHMRLIGQATIDRTDFNIGSGYWLEDDSIGFEVKISVDALFEPILK